MIAYYAQRAAEYERVYESPRWQDDLLRCFWVLEYRVG
jgi:hypothetical protein